MKNEYCCRIKNWRCKKSSTNGNFYWFHVAHNEDWHWMIPKIRCLNSRILVIIYSIAQHEFYFFVYFSYSDVPGNFCKMLLLPSGNDWWLFSSLSMNFIHYLLIEHQKASTSCSIKFPWTLNWLWWVVKETMTRKFNFMATMTLNIKYFKRSND